MNGAVRKKRHKAKTEHRGIANGNKLITIFIKEMPT